MPVFIRAATAAIACAFLLGCDDPQGPTISGTISMPEALQGQLGESDTLFIIAQPAGQAGGPPVAVKRMVGVRFPVTYTFDRQDMLRQDQPFAGELEIRASLRKSGIATVAVPGDVTGAYAHNPVEVGATGVDFALDQPVK